MIQIPSDLSSLDNRQLQELQCSAVQDLQSSQGLDFITASRRAKIMYPTLWAEKQRRADEAARNNQPAPLCNDADRAQIKQFTPSDDRFDQLGLNRQSSLDEYQAAAKGAGTDLANPDFEGAFDAVSTLAMRSRNISREAADSATAIRHPNLFKKSNMQKAAREIGANYPQPNAGFQKTTAPNKPLITARDVGFPNKTRSGLNVFNVKGPASIANADDTNLQDEYLSAFNTPASRAAAIGSVSKYLASQNGVFEEEAKKTIPDKVPHLAKVWDQHMKDFQN